MPSTLVDSGPLVALFSKTDRHRGRATEFIRRASGELLTNIPVVAEVAYLLRVSYEARRDFLGWVQDAVTIDFGARGDLKRIGALMDKYQDLPADFADVSLVAMAERLKIYRIATIDKDFTIYRALGKHPFENVFWSEG